MLDIFKERREKNILLTYWSKTNPKNERCERRKTRLLCYRTSKVFILVIQKYYKTTNGG